VLTAQIRLPEHLLLFYSMTIDIFDVLLFFLAECAGSQPASPADDKILVILDLLGVVVF